VIIIIIKIDIQSRDLKWMSHGSENSSSVSLKDICSQQRNAEAQESKVTA